MFFNLIVLISVLCVVSAFNSSTTTTLQSYNIKDVSVSGLSSGGFFAVQFHVAFSSIINGAAIFAGGPFYCAKDSITYAEYQCMKTTMGEPNIPYLVSVTKNCEQLKEIDSTSNLKDDRIYLFSGKDDTVVEPAVMQALQQYYENFVDVSNIVADYNVAAEHCLPTIGYGEKCSQLASPYIGKCDFDGAYNALSTIYNNPDLKAGTAQDKNLIAFSQTPFIVGKGTSIGDTGYIYVPTACQSGATACSLHVSFHGCEQGIAQIGNKYAADTGFNGWAEANNIIVLYPYVEESYSSPSNPNGCWDWWGYADKNYAVQAGTQMSFAKSLVDKVMGTK